ncbi:xyloglucan:xyloglucosyl transferase [Trifolium repens]|nr:xyloglucan:xyloglucosyl transferase [Trifolium repens]
MSKIVHHHKSLSESEISKLKNEILNTEGVKNLVSSDEDDFTYFSSRKHAVRPLLDPLSKLGFQEPSCAQDLDNVISIFYLLLLPLLSLNAESASLKSQVNQLAESSEKTEDGKCCIEAIIAANYYHSGEAAMSKGSFEDNFSIMWYEDHFTTSSDGQICCIMKKTLIANGKIDKTSGMFMSSSSLSPAIYQRRYLILLLLLLRRAVHFLKDWTGL